ncbi:MAG: alcohol dehydrogenase [Candidatus Marinimicrobia bacterium]|nr:alcohol dehydrogenase [Candidatus Neomarinimicrobiota bacterium]
MQSGVYEFSNMDRIIFGRAAKEAITETAAKLGKSRLMIVASKTLNRQTSTISEIKIALGEQCVGVFDECVEHAPRASVLALVARIKKLEPDLIVTIGGGSPMDTVKVSLTCIAENVTDLSGFDRIRISLAPDGKRIVPDVKDPPLRQIIVPTTLSGAEFSSVAGATDPVRKVKDIYSAKMVGGQVLILDPAITIHTSEKLWLSTGIRAIDHAVESICSHRPQPFVDANCLHALGMLSRSLRAVKKNPEDLDARLECQLGVWLASTGIGQIDWGASHGIGHQLGAVAGVLHGHCSCVMLPSVLRYNKGINSERQTMIARAMGQPSKSAADAVAELIADLEQPGNLRAVGVTRDHFNAIATGAMQNFHVRANPRPISSTKDIIEILEMAY